MSTKSHLAGSNARIRHTTNPRSDRESFASVDWILFVAVGVIWGSSFLLIKVGLETLHPGFITWARVGLGAMALSLIGRQGRKVEGADRRKVAVLSIVWVGIPFTLYPLAELHVSSAVAGLLCGATPFFAGLIGTVWFGRPSHGAQRLGMIIGFVGIALIATASGFHDGAAAAGVVMVLAATVCYGVATNLAGPLQQRYGSVRLMASMLAFGTLWTTPFGIVGAFQSHLAFGPVAAIVVLGVVGTGLAFVLMATLVGRVGGPRSSFITYLMPLVALAMGSIFLGERVTYPALVGAALVLVAALLASRPEKEVTMPVTRRQRLASART